MDIVTFLSPYATWLGSNIDLKLDGYHYWVFYKLKETSIITTEILNSEFEILEITL